MLSKIYKTLFVLLFFVFTNIAFAETSYDAKLQVAQEGYQKAEDNAQLVKHRNDCKKLYLKNYSYYKRVNDYDNALKSIMGALSFMKADTREYIKNEKKLEEILNKSDIIFDTDEAKLNLAWALNKQNNNYPAKYVLSKISEAQYDNFKYFEILGDVNFAIKEYKLAEEAYVKSLSLNDKNNFLNLKFALFYDFRGEQAKACEQYRLALEGTQDSNIIKTIISIFEDKIARGDENQNYYEILGTAYALIGENAKTYSLYSKALEIKPDDVFLRYILANFLHNIGQSERAIEIYDSILDNDIYEQQIRAGKAKCLVKLNRKKEAMKEYQSILLFYPNSLEAKYGIYQILKDKKEPLQIMHAFYPLNNNFRPSAEFIANFADELLILKQMEEAEKYYLLAYSVNQKSKQVLVKMYNFYALQGKDDIAEGFIEKAYSLYPTDKKVVEFYALANKSLIDKKTAQALVYINEKQYRKAFDTYNQITPKTDDIYFAMANCMKMAGDNKLAIENYKKALEINNNNFNTTYALAMAYYDKNDLDNTRIYLQKSLKIDSKNTPARTLLNVVVQKQTDDILNAAFEQNDLKNYKKADEIIEAGLKKIPDNAELYYFKGKNKEDAGEVLSAIREYENSIKINSEFTMSYYRLGVLYEQINEKKKALEAFETFLSKNTQLEEYNSYALERVEVLTREVY